jgi:amidophosphoribosyltransferase
VYEAVRGTRATHCDACFTGEYPLAGSDDANGKYALEEEQAPTGPSLPLVRA